MKCFTNKNLSTSRSQNNNLKNRSLWTRNHCRIKLFSGIKEQKLTHFFTFH